MRPNQPIGTFSLNLALPVFDIEKIPLNFTFTCVVSEPGFGMVLLTLTEAGKAAVDEYCRLKTATNETDESVEKLWS